MATTTTIEQALRCLQNAGFPAQPLIEAISKEPARLQKAEEQLKSLMYPDKKLSYYMSDRGVCILDLSEPASRILRIISASVGQTGLVSYSASGMEAISGITKKTVLGATSELVKKGALSVVRYGKSHIKAVYCVNPQIARCGKDGGQSTRFRNTIDTEPDIIKLDTRITISTITERKPPKGYDESLSYTLLEPINTKKAAGHKTDDSSKSSSINVTTDTITPSTKDTVFDGQLSLDDIIKDGELPW